MDRRQFLQYGAAGAATSLAVTDANAQTGSAVTYNLSIEPVDAEMIDGSILYMRLFYGGPAGSETPRQVLRANEFAAVTIRVTNNAPSPHGFSIPGIPAATIASIAPGQTGTVTFTAPTAGTYMYLDHVNAPVNRLVGLHGAFVIKPRYGNTPLGAPTPYSYPTQTAAVRALFNALGQPGGRFPGQRWNPDDPEREKIWMFTQHDPALNNAVKNGQSINAAGVINTFLPRYFTINGVSGYDAGHDESIVPRGYVGQPTLLRVLNAGLATHSPHIHGNHVMELTHTLADGSIEVQDNIYEIDSWTMAPLDRIDLLLPYERPPSIPVWPPRQEPFPMRYVMHCHNEVSQTAGGGNYPQGLVTHWELLGPSIPAIA